MKEEMTAELAPAIDLPPPPEPSMLETFRRGRLMRSDPLACTRRMYESEGPVVGQRMGLFRSVNLFGPDAVKHVVLNREGIFSNKQAWDLIIGKIFTNGLMLRDGEDHRYQRSIMQGAFKRPALEEYLAHMNPQIAARLSHWRATDSFLVYPAFKRLTLDLACSVFLGIELGPEAERVNRAFEDTVAASMAVMRLRLPGLAWTRGLEGREYMVEFLHRLIPAKRKDGGSDMFSQLCRAESEEGDKFSDQEIIDHMIFLMMAAHDTTTSTLTSMMYELAQHPEWQDRLREESRALGKDQIDFKDLESPGAVSLVMNETLRRYPPLSTMPRMATREFQYGGYGIPAGTMVIVFPIHTHHMSEWWTNPFSFDPERFSEARAEHRRHSHSFVPFGGGAHMCIGFRFAEIQIRAILHQIVQRFRWSVREGYSMPVQQSPISKPKDGLPVQLEALA
jgi:cytochrome P450